MMDIIISATYRDGLSVTVNGKPARLAVITDDGVIAQGDDVAREAYEVSASCHCNHLIGEGHLRVLSEPIQPQQ